MQLDVLLCIAGSRQDILDIIDEHSTVSAGSCVGCGLTTCNCWLTKAAEGFTDEVCRAVSSAKLTFRALQ